MIQLRFFLKRPPVPQAPPQHGGEFRFALRVIRQIYPATRIDWTYFDWTYSTTAAQFDWTYFR